MRTILNWFVGYIIKVILMYLMLVVFGVIAFIALILIDDYKTAVEWIMGVPTNGLGKVVLSMPIWFPLLSSLKRDSFKKSPVEREVEKYNRVEAFNDYSFFGGK